MAHPSQDFEFRRYGNRERRFTATQLCVLEALQAQRLAAANAGTKQQQRRPSLTLDVQQGDEILGNYGLRAPSVSFVAAVKPRKTKAYFWKNLMGVSLGVLCLLTAYDVFFYIQSSLNERSGLGTLALAVDYASQVLASMFLPPLIMRKMGCKWSLVASMVGILLFLASNMYPHFFTMIPAAAAMGFGFATMWATMNTLVSELGTGYSRLTGLTAVTAQSRFFGIFYMIIETANIWGNLISSYILSPDSSIVDGYINASQLEHCGGRYCNQKLDIIHWILPLNVTINVTEVGDMTFELDPDTQLELESHGGASQRQLYGLGVVAVSLAVLAMLVVAALLDNTRAHPVISDDGNLTRITTTLRLLGNPKQQMLVLVTVVAGLMQSFFVGDFTKAFLTCSLGIHQVGMVSTCYGVTTVLGSFVMGFMSQWIGRLPLVVTAVLLNFGNLMAMLFWTPDPEALIAYYVLAGVWGLALAIWLTQLTALYGQVFRDKQEEGFSNHRLWSCVGFVIGFTWAHYLCLVTKIYIMSAMLFCGLVGYLGVEVMLWNEQRLLHVYSSNHRY